MSFITFALSSATDSERSTALEQLTSHITSVQDLPYNFSSSFTQYANEAVAAVKWAQKVKNILSSGKSRDPPTLQYLEELSRSSLPIIQYNELRELKLKIELCGQWVKRANALLQNDVTLQHYNQLLAQLDDLNVYIDFGEYFISVKSVRWNISDVMLYVFDCVVELVSNQIAFLQTGGLEGTSLKSDLPNTAIPVTVSRQKSIMKNKFQVINAGIIYNSVVVV